MVRAGCIAGRTPRGFCHRLFTAGWSGLGAVPSPAGGVPGRRDIRKWKTERNSSWPGPASSPQVSRSRAMPVGGRRPVLPVGARCRAPSCPREVRAEKGALPTVGSLPPRPCGPLCRPEVGVPGPARRPAREGYVPRREPSRQLGPCRRGPAGRCADRRSAFPGLRAALPVRGTRRDGSHPPGWGPCRRGPAGRCAGLKTGVPGPVRHPLCRGLGATFFVNRLRFSRVRFGP